MTKCECGAELGYEITPFMTNYTRRCEHCGKLNYIDTAPIDFGKVVNREYLEKRRAHDAFWEIVRRNKHGQGKAD